MPIHGATPAETLPPAPRVTHPETKASTLVEPVETARGFREFQRVPDLVYWADPFYVPPLKRDERALFDRDRSPLLRNVEARLFTAWHGHRRPVGRIAAFATGARSGCFGFFEFMNDARLPEALLAEAAGWLRSRGAEEIAGPVAFGRAFDAQRGLLVDGFHDDPVLGTTYNPPSYAGFLARLGLEKSLDEHGYDLDTTSPPPERLAARAAEVAARDGLSVRPADLARLDDELEAVRAIREEASRSRPRFVPEPAAGRGDDRGLGRLLGLFPGGALILEERGKPAGYVLALVDYNRVLKHMSGSRFPIGWLKALMARRTIDRVRVLGAAVLGEGRGRILPLAHALWANLHAARFTTAHLAPVPEDHARALKLVEGLGAKRTRTWRVFKVPASFPGDLTPSRGPA